MFFSLLTFLGCSMAKSKIYLGKYHIELENMWIIFKYLLILISNIIPQWSENRLCMISVPLDREFLFPFVICPWIWSMPYKVIQDGWVMVDSSNKTWFMGEGNGKPLQNSCPEKSINNMKRKKKKLTLKDKFSRLVGVQ